VTNNSDPEAGVGGIQDHRPHRTPLWPRVSTLLAVYFVVRGIYWIHTRPIPIVKPSTPGWDQLEPCSSLSSLSGGKYLTLFEDQHAELVQYAPAENGKDSADIIINGRWCYEPSSAQYSITIEGNTTSYSLFAPEHLAICILAKGAMDEANLYDSWFTYVDYDRSD